MPELKRIFNAGKMNRDLDDRLVPPGEYREALNINIGRSEGSDVGAVENLLGNSLKTNTAIPDNAFVIGSLRDNSRERIYFFVTTNDSASGVQPADNADYPYTHQIWEYEQLADSFNLLAAGRWLNFWTGARITGVNILEDLLFWTDNRNEPRRINVNTGRGNQAFYDSDDVAAVIKFAPIEAPVIRSIRASSDPGESNFLRDKLPRFSYRYQYEDGEYSVLAPFSPIVFQGPDGNIALTDGVATGDFSNLVNLVKDVTLAAPVPSVEVDASTVRVEFLYKETTNSTIYILGDGNVETDANNNITGFRYTYLSQDPFRALPGSQLTRVSDAVPRLAQAQEIAGGRIVYGNFLQDYDLPVGFDYTVSLAGTPTPHAQLPDHSVKSRRTYQVGIVLSDRFGRTSPVLLSSSGTDSIFVPASSDNSIQKLEVDFTGGGFPTNFPDWAYSYKVVVKQREQEYYNVFGTFSGAVIPRMGDTVNKVPFDSTQTGDFGTGSRPTSEKLYAKVDSNGALSTDDTLYSPTGISGNGEIELPAITNFTTETVAFETEPFISELDIFFETSTGGLVSEITNMDGTRTHQIDFYNCFIQPISDSAHLEINRIRAGFNEPFFDVGVRAHVVNEDFAGESRRGAALIHSSGLFNSRTSINQLNQFNAAEGGITVSLDPSDGSIQKLFAEDTQLLIWQEDKVSRSPVDKDFIYSAEGGAVPVTSNSQYLGTIAPYAGEYGISQDPDSFAVYGTRKYFTDKNRGVVLRLSQDGLSEISGAGMNDFFRDALRTSERIIGSYDEYHDSYNLTIIGEGYVGNESTNIATVRENTVFNTENPGEPERDIDYFTVSFEEDVKGWNSFKSFKQEAGLTLNNVYYTFSGGNLWEHNTNETRNNFYGIQYASQLELIFNDAPSVIKEFKTLATEGNEPWECEFLETDLQRFGGEDEVVESRAVTLNFNLIAPHTQDTSSRVTRMVAEGSRQEWPIAFNADRGFLFTNPDQLVPTTGTPPIEGLTSFPEQEIVGGSFVMVVQYEAPAEFSGDNDLTLNINIGGDGPANDVTGTQFVLTIDHTPGLGVGEAQWLDQTGAPITADTININASDFRFELTPPLSQPRSYRLSATRTEDDNGVLDITDDVYYFPADATDATSPDAAFITSGIGFPDNDPEVLYTGGVFDSLNQTQSTIEFAGTTGVDRNDIIVSNVFEVPDNPSTGRIDFRGTGIEDLPKYPVATIRVVSDQADPVNMLLAGPTNDNSGEDELLANNIEVTVNRSATDMDTAMVDPIQFTGTPADLPQTYNIGAFSFDPRATDGTFKMRLIANNHPTAIIPNPMAGENLPEGWEITGSGNINITRAEFNAVAHGIDIEGTITIPNADDNVSLNIHGHPLNGTFTMVWDQPIAALSNSIIEDATENIHGENVTVSTLRIGGTVGATDEARIIDYVYGDVLAQIDLGGVNHHTGLVASRFLMERSGPTEGTIINLDIRPDDSGLLGVSNIPGYNRFNALVMPIGGPRYQSESDDPVGYDSSNRLSQAPYRIDNLTNHREYNTERLGYGWVGQDADGTATVYRNIAWPDNQTLNQSGWRISMGQPMGYAEEFTFHRVSALRAGVDLSGSCITFQGDPTRYYIVNYRPNDTETGGTFELDRALEVAVALNTDINYNPNPGEHGFQGELHVGDTGAGTGSGFYVGDVQQVTFAIPYNPYPYSRVARVTALNTTQIVPPSTTPQLLTNYEAIRGQGLDYTDATRNLLVTQPGVPIEDVLARWQFLGTRNEAMSHTVPAAVHYANWTGSATDMDGDGEAQLTRVGLPVYRVRPNTNQDTGLMAAPYTNAYSSGGTNPTGVGVPNLWFGFDVDRNTNFDPNTTDRGNNNSRSRRAAGNTGTMRIESRWDMRTHLGNRRQPYVIRAEFTHELVRGGSRQDQAQISNMDFRVREDDVTATLVPQAGNGVDFTTTQLVTNGEIVANNGRLAWSTTASPVPTIIDLTGANTTRIGNFAEFRVEDADLHTHVLAQTPGLRVTANYQGRAWSGICLSRYNRNGDLNDLTPRTTTDAIEFGQANMGQTPQFMDNSIAGGGGMTDGTGRHNNDYATARTPHHRTDGIPRYYVGHLPDPEQPQEQGAPQFTVRQVVYFVPMMPDENGWTAPYRGGDMATIAANTNNTFLSRTLGDIHTTPSVPPQVSHNVNGDVQIITTNIDNLEDDITPPQLIVFVDQRAFTDGFNIAEHISQLEMLTDIETVHSDGAQDTGYVGFMRISAVDFLDEYFDAAGNPQFYPEMNRDTTLWENTGHLGTDKYYLDNYGTAGFALQKRPT